MLCLLFLGGVYFGQMKLPGSILGLTACDLLREKGPTTVKRRFKNAVNCAFPVDVYFCKLTAVERISLMERKKEEKTADNLILLI